MRQDVLKSAKSADQKLLFVPILLILGRFWGTLRFLLYVGGQLPIGNTPIGAWNKALLALQVCLNNKPFCSIELKISPFHARLELILTGKPNVDRHFPGGIVFSD